MLMIISLSFDNVNDNVNDKYSNNRHIFIEIISKKLKVLAMNIDNKLKFAHTL